MFPAVDVAAGTMEMEDGPREEGTKEEPDKFEEDENLALEHLSGVSLSTDTTGLRDDLVAEALAEFLAKFANGGSVYRCEACPVYLYFSSADPFWKHFEDEHLVDELRVKTEAEEYRRAHPNFRVESAPKDRCKACGTKLRCDKWKWSRHLKKDHGGMSLEEYFVRYEFVPVSGESEEVEREETRANEEREKQNNGKEEEDRKEGTVAVAGCSTLEENAVPSTPEPRSNTNTEEPTDVRLTEQVDDCNNEGNKTTAECSLADVKIEQVRTIDPHEDDRDGFGDEIEFHCELVAEEHPIIIGPENPDTKILNQPFLNILKLQEMRERYNLCLYECQICLALFDSFVGIVSHLNSRHEINFADHEAYYGRARVMENFSFCEICHHDKFDARDVDTYFRVPSQIFSDGHPIQRHLLNAHGLNLLQYDKIVRGEDLWFDTCVYRCRLCPSATMFAGSREFETHFAAEHAGEKKKAAMAVVCKSNYECVICQKVVPGVPGVFDQHLSQKHGLETADYLKLFLQWLLRPGAKVIRVEVPAVEVPREWYNGCLFKCSICQAYLNGSDHLSWHVDAKHGMPYQTYR